MAYNNTTSWDIDGVLLQTLATNIETTTGLSLPPMRGDDVVIPYRPGQIFQAKQPDSRIIPFQMWVRGSNPDGSEPNGKSRREKFYDNWLALASLVWRPGQQFVLTKRFPYNGGTKTVVALAQFDSGMEPTLKGPHAAKFTMNLKLADPWFYDADWKQTNIANGSNMIDPGGNVETRNVRVLINANRVNPQLYNTINGVSLRFNTSVTAGGATIDCYNYDSNINGARSNGAVTHSGSASWMVLKPRAQQIDVSSDSGSGFFALQTKGAWI